MYSSSGLQQFTTSMTDHHHQHVPLMKRLVKMQEGTYNNVDTLSYHLAPMPFALLLRLSGTVSLLMSAHVLLS